MENDIETIKVDKKHKLVIKRAWNQTAWMYRVKKYQKLWGLFWAAGWLEDNTYLTRVVFFPTLQDARDQAEMIRRNFLGLN